MSRATPVQKKDSLVFGNDSEEFYLNTRTGLLSKTLIWVSHFCDTLNALKLGAPPQMIRSGDAVSNATTGTNEVHWLARAANPCRSWRFLSSTETSSSSRTRQSSRSPKICRFGASAESYGLLNFFIKSFLKGSEPSAAREVSFRPFGNGKEHSSSGSLQRQFFSRQLRKDSSCQPYKQIEPLDNWVDHRNRP